jgi:hypothetical protein
LRVSFKLVNTTPFKEIKNKNVHKMVLKYPYLTSI